MVGAIDFAALRCQRVGSTSTTWTTAGSDVRNPGLAPAGLEY